MDSNDKAFRKGSRGMITEGMMAEWAQVVDSPGNYSAWVHTCKDREPELFTDYWEVYVRGLMARMAREAGMGFAMNPGAFRSLEQVAEQCFYMGFFFAERRMQDSISSMNSAFEIEHQSPPEGPNLGGIDPKDFVL